MKNIICISPISIFGPILKFAILKKHQTIIEYAENYQKGSFRSRTKILSANGVLLLSVPLVKGKTKQQIKDVEISYQENWVKDHLEAIRSAYGKSPYFEFYFEEIQEIYLKKSQYLCELSELIYSYLKKRLSLPDLQHSSEYLDTSHYKIDLRTKTANVDFSIPRYNQVFEDKYAYVPNLSILDLLFNLGPESEYILNQTVITFHDSVV